MQLKANHHYLSNFEALNWKKFLNHSSQGWFHKKKSVERTFTLNLYQNYHLYQRVFLHSIYIKKINKNNDCREDLTLNLYTQILMASI